MDHDDMTPALELYNQIRQDAIDEAVAKHLIEIEGRHYLAGKLVEPPVPKMPTPIKVSSLGAVVSYIDSDDAGVGLLIVVTGHRVEVLGPMDPYHRTRPTYLSATHGRPATPRVDLGHEEALVYLQQHFAETRHRAAYLVALGKVVAGREIQVEDDGVTQALAVQQGARGEWKSLPRPATLRPFVWPEIEPIESSWILRLAGEPPNLKITLHEVDSDHRELALRQAVIAYLEERLADRGSSYSIVG